jgi:hypothetical protein
MCRLEKQPPPSKRRSKKRLKGYGVPRGWVEVASAPDQIAAGMLEGALKEAGIPVILNRPPTFAYLGIGGVHGVMVPEDCLAQARDILREIWDIQE